MTTSSARRRFPLLVKHVLPVGVRGIVVAGLLAALMSSLAGVFNASSTLFTMDLYSKFRPKPRSTNWCGWAASPPTVMVVIGLAWVPVIQGAHGLYHYLQGVQGYLAPPIFVVFFLGVFMKRLNGSRVFGGPDRRICPGRVPAGGRHAGDPGSVRSRTAGQFENGYAEGSFLWIVNNMYFQYYSLLIFIVCVVVMIVVSYADRTAGCPEDQRTDVRDDHRGASARVAKQLGCGRRVGLVPGAGADPGRVPVLHWLALRGVRGYACPYYSKDSGHAHSRTLRITDATRYSMNR